MLLALAGCIEKGEVSSVCPALSLFHTYTHSLSPPHAHTHTHNAQVCKAQRANTALAESLRARGHPGDDLVAERLIGAADLLGALSSEITASEDSSPGRVIFLKADPAVVITLVSFISTILYLQISDLRQFFPTFDNNSTAA